MEQSADLQVHPRERRRALTRTRVLVMALVLLAGSIVGYVAWERNQGVHAGDTYRVVLTRHGCQQADPLYIDGWAWTGGLPAEYGDGPVPGKLHVDSVDRRTATFVADAGWSAQFKGDPSGFSDLSCSVAG